MRIGISAGATTDTAACERAVRLAGAEPIVLRPGGTRGAEGIEGLLLAGGVDVEPARLGEEMPPELAGLVMVEADRDELEWELLDHATRLGMPVLGICRGVQVLNAYLGGSLYLDLPAAGFRAVDHRQRDRMQEPVHEVLVLGGRLSRLMGDERAVNSSHHQAVREPAPGLVVTARSEDGVIEGLESPDGLLLGVQWHPETLIERSPAARAIFTDLVARVRWPRTACEPPESGTPRICKGGAERFSESSEARNHEEHEDARRKFGG